MILDVLSKGKNMDRMTSWEESYFNSGWHIILPLPVSQMMKIIHLRNGIMISELKKCSDHVIDYSAQCEYDFTINNFRRDNGFEPVEDFSAAMEFMVNLDLVSVHNCQVFYNVKPPVMECDDLIIGPNVQGTVECFSKIMSRRIPLLNLTETLIMKIKTGHDNELLWGELNSFCHSDIELVFDNVLEGLVSRAKVDVVTFNNQFEIIKRLKNLEKMLRYGGGKV